MNRSTKQIGVVARELGINPKTIRYYEEIELIPRARRNASGFRMYDEGDIERLAFILRARALDFSLDDIGEILAFREQGEAPCLYVTGLVQQQIAAVDARIAALQQLRHDLEDIHKSAQALPHAEIANKDCICHLIENRGLIAAETTPVSE